MSGFEGRSVLVTGATGTIGSEIVKQVLAQGPRVVRVFSRDESKQAHLRQELAADAPVRYLIGDVRDRARLRTALAGIDTVFHAAALKHVTACEYNPFEAVQTNVGGTQNLIEACRESGVQRLVAISTDKAVNPVNTMGATKLLAENVLYDAWKWSPDTAISTVRFGNVLGSRGSLIPLMVRSMESERRVHLTSGEMTRFMMTISDAVELVLHAAAENEGGEICILKMPALRVGDLVETFVAEYSRRRGWSPDAIEIVETGVGPGEKMHEELVTKEECGRLEERERMYVVPPYRRSARELAFRDVPADCRSEHCTHLDRDGIVELLERSGIFEQLARTTSLADFVTS